MISLDETLAKVRGVLSAELEHPRVNGLTEIVGHKIRRNALKEYMNTIDAELDPVRQVIKGLPALPSEQEIQWAQAIMAMQANDSVRFLEIDTTGLTDQDEIVRVTLVDLAGTLTDDLFFKPSHLLSAEASAANGLTDEILHYAPDLQDMWEIIRARVYGHYVLSFSQAFDIKKLNEAAARHHLAPIVIVGDDLQRHVTQYYNREYYLTLADVCERIGHPLKSNSAVNRATGQYHLLKAMAEGDTDVRPPKLVAPSTAPATSDDGLDGLDEHPF